MICPECKQSFIFTSGTYEQMQNCTCDCPNPKCGILLLVENGIVYDFNKKLHERDQRWPADGKGTHSIEV